jgi:hypothetical protein
VRNAIALGREIAANGPLAVLAAKQTIVESLDWPLDGPFARQQAIYGPVRASEDVREGRACVHREACASVAWSMTRRSGEAEVTATWR